MYDKKKHIKENSLFSIVEKLKSLLKQTIHYFILYIDNKNVFYINIFYIVI